MPSFPLPSEPVFRCVGFDFDGTLANTTPAIVATLQGTLEECGYPPPSREHILPLIGLPLLEVFVRLGVRDQAAPHCAAHYRELFPTHSTEVQLFPHVRRCLEELKAREVGMAIVSSRSRASLHQLLDQLEIGDYFSQIFGGEDATRGKPAPDMVLQLAQALKIAPSHILVVGDTSYDIEMGRAAGAQTCAVTYGNHDAARLAAAKPHHRLDSLAALGALLFS